MDADWTLVFVDGRGTEHSRLLLVRSPRLAQLPRNSPCLRLAVHPFAPVAAPAASNTSCLGGRGRCIDGRVRMVLGLSPGSPPAVAAPLHGGVGPACPHPSVEDPRI